MKVKKETINLLSLLICTVAAGAITTAIVCEEETLELECADGQVIHIVDALYGKIEPYPGCTHGIEPTDCRAPTSLRVLQNKCHHKYRCTVEAINIIFTDPCRGFRKYLEVNYSCEVTQNTTVCQNESLELNCGEGMVIHIIDALYRRTESSPSCNNGRSADTCRNPDSLSILNATCDDKIKCSVRAGNDFFGGVTNCLEVTYSCVDKEPPVAKCVPGVERSIGVNSEGTNVLYAEPTATDNSGNVAVLERTHEPGEFFPLGVTPVTYTFADAAGLTATCTFNVTVVPEIPPKCPSAALYLDGMRITFPESQDGNQTVNSSERCPSSSSKPNHVIATRYCGESWGEAKRIQCFDEEALETQLNELDELDLTMANVHEVAGTLLQVSTQVEDISPAGRSTLISVLGSVVATGNASEEVTDSVVGVTINFMALEGDMLANTSNINEVVPLLETQIRAVQDLGENYTRSLPSLGISALRLGRTSLERYIQYEDPFMEGSETGDGNDKWSSIGLPPSILDMIDEAMTSVPVSFIAYRDAGLFQPGVASDEMQDTPNKTYEYVEGRVIAAAVDINNVLISELPQNSTVLVTFSEPSTITEGSNSSTTIQFLCVFWDFNESDRTGRWSERGCNRIDTEEEGIICSCDHLTSFAVMVRITDITDIRGDERFQLALHIITVVGCAISILGLACCVMAMLVFRSLRRKQQTHVHFNLCLALLGLYLSFLLGVDKIDQPELCRAMTSVIYFFCVSSVAWMAVEGFYIYMLIWKYKQNSIGHLIPVAVTLAWGLPLIAAILVYLLDGSHDYSADADYCFLHPGPALYSGFLPEVFVLFLFNFTIFLLATFRVNNRRIRSFNKEENRRELVTRIKSTFLFWVILGMAWMFGFLATFQSPLSLAFQVLFCVCLSMQGFAMFYLLVVQNPEIRKFGLQSLSWKSKQASITSAAAVAATPSTRVQGSSFSPSDPTYGNQALDAQLSYQNQSFDAQQTYQNQPFDASQEQPFGAQDILEADEGTVDNIIYGLD